MAGARVDPALEPLGAALDGAGVGRLAGHDGAGRRGVVGLEEAVEPLLGGGGIRVEGEGDVGRARHRVRLPARRAGGRLDLREVLGEELHAGPGGEPGVEARRFAEGNGPAAPDPDGRPARAMGLGVHGDVLEGEVLAVEAHAVAAPQGLADLQDLQEAADAPLEGNADVLELLADGRGVARDANAEDDPALRDAVERGHDLGEDDGLA